MMDCRRLAENNARMDLKVNCFTPKSTHVMQQLFCAQGIKSRKISTTFSGRACTHGQEGMLDGMHAYSRML